MIFTTASAQTLENSAGFTAEAALPGRSTMREPRSAARVVRTLRTFELHGTAGRLEALLSQGVPDAKFAALVCHPHPLGGGSLHNKVVYHAAKALNDPGLGLGFPVLRFNFRGVGRSEGKHHGAAEVEDVLTAIDWLQTEFNLPIVAAGFSFGAAMVLQACCHAGVRPGVRALVALGLPIAAQDRAYEYSFLNDVIIPKLFLSGDHDEFASSAQLRQVFASAAEPKRLIFLPGADHFFTGQLETMQQALAGWLKEQLL
ncbi:MAG TPA: alpha/beta fold hydrolase [Terracidiphilus sp.]|jgi:hypothetical protein